VKVVSIANAIAGANADILVSRAATHEVGLAGLFAKLTGRRFVYSSANVSDFRDDWPVRQSSPSSPFETRLAEAEYELGLRFSPAFHKSAAIGELFRLGIRLADEIVVPIEEQVDLCVKRFGRSPAMIKSIAELAPQRTSEPEAFLWIARLVSYKRPLAFVELARALPRSGFGWWRLLSTLRTVNSLPRLSRPAGKLHNLEVLTPRPEARVDGPSSIGLSRS